MAEWDAQKREAALKKEKELRDALAYDSAMDSILKTLDERKFEEAAEVQATNDSLRAHWRMQTDRSLRPEWDIIDPDTLKKTLPPRAEDGTSRVGPSAIQVFECETKSSPDEKARRNREFVRANDAILRERAAARARAEEEARRDGDAERSLLSTFASMDRDAFTESSVERLKLRDENKRLMMERKTQQRLTAEAERAAEREHVEYMRAHPLLTEAPVGVLTASGRFRKDAFKGLSAETADAVRREQEQQRRYMEAERQRLRQEDLDDAERLRAALAVYDAVAAGDKAEDLAATRTFVLDIKTQQRAAKVARGVEE